MTSLAPNLKETVEENKSNQDELREIQLKQDEGHSFGPDLRNPCKKEQSMYENCLKYKGRNDFVNCNDYWVNLKKCNQFWDAVQDYRVNVLNKSGLELPRNEEFTKWQKQMPDWYITDKLTPPEDL